MKKGTLKTARFTDNGDGTVTDPTTGLMWAKATLTCGEVTHTHAIKACSAIRIGGHKDWRMPTRRELLTLVDDTRASPAIDTSFFTNTENDWYWTSTLCAWGASCAWIVNFNYGYVRHLHRNGRAFVRAVRSVKTP